MTNTTKLYINTETNEHPLYFYDIKAKENIETEAQIPAKYKELVDGGYDKPFDPLINDSYWSKPELVNGKWTWKRIVTVKPPPPKVTNRQMRRALLDLGLLDDVDTFFTTFQDQTFVRKIKIDWEYGTEVERGSPFVLEFSKYAGMTNEQVDGLFVLANTL